MNITLYTSFSKRKNSTKVPTGGTLVQNVELKKPTSLHDPIFVLGPVTGVTMENVTYVKAFNHYFFVTDITVTPHDYFEITCTEDPMASNKSGILGSTQYVMYSASMHNDFIPDNRIAMFPMASRFSYTATIPFLENKGFYVLSVVNSFASSTGVTTTYLLDEANMLLLANFINVDLMALDTASTTVFEKLRSLMSGPFDYITSIRYIPFDLTTVTTELSLSQGYVYLGVVQATASGTPVEGWILGYNSVFDITDQLELSELFSQDFRIAPQYTKLHALIPGYGEIDLDPVSCQHGFMVKCYIDAMTGDVTAVMHGFPTAYNTDPLLLATYNYNIAIPLPLAQMTSDAGSVISGIGTAIAGAAAISAGAGFTTTLSTSVASANQIAQGLKPSGSVKGSIAGKSFIGEKYLRLEVEQAYTQDLDVLNATHGRPLMQEVTLSTLSGYCQCANASVELNCMESDRDFINNCLNSGFFIE